MALDVGRARSETPGCEHVTHFNNAGAALPPAPVTAAVIDHLRLEEEIGGYEAADAAQENIEHTYDAVAALLGCRRDEIALTDSATRAWDAAFYAFRFRPGDRILTSRAEYASNAIAILQASGRTGLRVEVVDDDRHGQLDVADLRRRLDDDVRLIAVTHVPTQGGLVNPAAEIGAVARSAGVPFLLDACQSAGQLPLDVDELGCDVLSATGRKFLRAPRGTGFLYVRRSLLEALEPPMLDLRAATWVSPDRYEMRPDARRFETWEASIAGRIGLGVAVDYARSWGLDAIEGRVTALADELRAALGALPGVEVHDQGLRRCGIVTFTVAGVPAADVKARLAAQRINTSVTSAASAQYDLPARHLDEMVRASVHYYNTSSEIHHLVAALRAVP